MGEVWLADDAELADRVALKLLDPRLSESAACVDLLRRECSRARSLVHPNIVRVFDFHAAGDRYFVSMQYIDGGTLLDSRGAAFQLIVHQALMVCDALDYAHRAGLIHRDVKPSNVLVDRNGVCYLTDFGIATAVLPYHLGSDVPPGGGTLPSMSPQQLAAEPPAVADDVYSLGALLHELLSGAPLFHPDVTPERVRAEMPAPLLTDQTGQALPDALVKLVPATLSKSPASRPAGIAAVRSVLEEVRADFPQTPGTGDVIRPVGRRGPVPAAVDRPPRRRAETTGTGLSPAMVYGGLVALLVIALAVIFMLPRAVDE
ncbi:MAG: serine/threonine-protein kinase, partial [Gammaproteobacteria bacterium]